MNEPPRIARLPHDSRGYPIPWNVLRGVDNTPFFTINDDRKTWEALQKDLCPICGQKIGRWHWFVGGPRSAFDPAGGYVDLPGHYQCIEFALQTCPFLAMPKFLRRLDVIHPELLPPEARVLLDETQIPERPEIFVAVAAAKMEVYASIGMPHVKPLRPYLDWSYWRHGRRISEEEALPFLQAALGAEWIPPGKAAEGF